MKFPFHLRLKLESAAHLQVHLGVDRRLLSFLTRVDTCLLILHLHLWMLIALPFTPVNILDQLVRARVGDHLAIKIS
jgi:hypothetical protein